MLHEARCRPPRGAGGESSTRPVLFSVGLMADLQYADLDNGESFVEKSVRRYRQSLDILRSGAAEFALAKTSINVLLGDLIDFKSTIDNKADLCLSRILEITKAPGVGPFHFIVGNHDLNAFSRPRVHSQYLPPSVRAATPPSGEILYYSLKPHAGFKFLFLDPFDVSSFNASSEAKQRQAQDLLKASNPNMADDKKNGNWFTGLSPEDRRYVPYNGMIGVTQLRWLQDELLSATRLGERVIVFSHLPIFSRCVDPGGLMWNAEPVLEIVHLSPCVVAWVSGHDHQGGYAVDEFGVHHIIPPAPLECDEGQVAFGVLHIDEAGGSLVWRGKCPTNKLATQDPWPTSLPWRKTP